jgi:hypothetical protein
MKRMILAAMLSIFLTVLFMPSFASADWSIRLGDDGWNPAYTTHYNFDRIDFFIPSVNSGITWAGSGASNFSLPNWTVSMISPTHVQATNSLTPASILFWNLSFTGISAPNNFILDYVVYAANSPAYGITMSIPNGVPVFTQTAQGQGPGWSTMSSSQIQTYNNSSVPVPPAILLFSTGLIGVAALRKRLYS